MASRTKGQPLSPFSDSEEYTAEEDEEMSIKVRLLMRVVASVC